MIFTIATSFRPLGDEQCKYKKKMEKQIEELRNQFNKETNIAAVFAERTPYIQYINWLELKLLEKK